MRDDRWQMQCSGEPELAGVRLKMETEVIAKQKTGIGKERHRRFRVSFRGGVAVLRNLLATSFILLTAANITVILSAQTPQGQAATTDAQKPIEQLIEQNRKLEQQNQQLMEQNRELMEQINSLRPSLAKQDRTVQSGPAENPPSPVQPGPPGTSQQAVNQTTDQDSDQDQSKDDDSALLPNPSGGNPAIFGEFNPGRGFNVAKGEYGELNLS